MVPLSVRFHTDRDELIFPDIEEGKGVEAEITEVVVVANGVEGSNGRPRPSVVIRVELGDGKTGVAITTARLMIMLARMIEARHPELMREPD